MGLSIHSLLFTWKVTFNRQKSSQGLRKPLCVSETRYALSGLRLLPVSIRLTSWSVSFAVLRKFIGERISLGSRGLASRRRRSWLSTIRRLLCDVVTLARPRGPDQPALRENAESLSTDRMKHARASPSVERHVRIEQRARARGHGAGHDSVSTSGVIDRLPRRRC